MKLARVFLLAASCALLPACHGVDVTAPDAAGIVRSADQSPAERTAAADSLPRGSVPGDSITSDDNGDAAGSGT